MAASSKAAPSAYQQGVAAAASAPWRLSWQQHRHGSAVAWNSGINISVAESRKSAYQRK